MSKSKSGGGPKGSSSTGTLRLAFAFGTGIVGVFYLIFVIMSVTSGRIEASPTKVDIDTIEGEGFPDADYLEVHGGRVVLRYANAWVTGRGDQRKLFHLKAPVVSAEQLEAWRKSREAGEALDLSRLRLVAVFDGEMVAEKWPDVKRLAEADLPLDAEAVPMTLAGETVVAKGQLSLPQFPPPRSESLDWAAARHLRQGVHHDSIGNLLKNILIAAALLAASFFTFRYHFRHPTRPPPAGLDLTPLADGTLDLD